MSSLSPRCQLLVSVRSPEESRLALAGGADLIDVKEPRNGSLGRADDAILRGVQYAVANQCPVSAAMGELRENQLPSLFPFQYLKWGLAGFYSHQDWRGQLGWLRSFLQENGSPAQVVNVAYADWKPAQAPPVKEVVDFACERPGSVLLIDTWDKVTGKTLLDWLSIDDLLLIRTLCRKADVRLALAGSLREKQIVNLLEVQPDWFAVRGAVCSSGRESVLSVEKVQRLKHLVLKHPG